jgi:hypothetical protein
MSDRPKYHQSALHSYLKCGKLYEFRYIKGLKIPPKAALTVGTAVDKAVSANMVKKIQGATASIDEILTVASESFDANIKDTVLEDDESPGELKDQTVALARLHFETVAPTIQPETVQEEFVLELDGDFDLGGTIDLTDANGFIRDTKTSTRARASSYVVERSVQPAMYSIAYEAIRGKKAKGFVFDILKKPTIKLGPEYQATEGVVTDSDHNWLLDSIDQVHKGITAGIALPAPEGSWYCSEKWCGYWNICKGRKN